MIFELDEEQQLFRNTVDRLFETHAGAGPRDAAAEWQAYAELGLLALPFAEDVGGLGGTHETVMLLMEGYGRTLGQAPYLSSVLLAGRLLARCGNAAAQPALAMLMEGRSRAALCLHEPGRRYHWDEPTTRAVRTDAGWRIDGRKVAVLDGDNANLLVCPAGAPEGLALFLIPAGTAGVTIEAHPTPDRRGAANVTFSVVTVPHEALIGDPATSSSLLAEAIDGAMVACCAEAVGAMERLLGITTEYLRTRVQFGVPIGSFQALQHRAADMLVAVEQARSITYYAVSMLDAPAEERSTAVAAAKALVNRASRHVGSEAIQLHGGMGLASEYPAGRYFQRLTVIETLFGDTDHLLQRVEQAGGLPA